MRIVALCFVNDSHDNDNRDHVRLVSVELRV